MAMWTRDYATGETICAVCGAKKGNRKHCCKTAPYISFESFKKRYFAGDDVNDLIAKEFYSDYRLSDCTSLKQYIEETTSTI